MTINTTTIINSIEDYVLDIKPYHSKLSEVIVEFAFFDDVNVHITESHSIQALMSSIWSSDYISNPITSSTRYQLRAPFSNPTFFHNLNSFDGSTYLDGTLSEFNYKLFNKRFREDTKLVRKNGIPQLEGHDYFQTKGAYSFTILPDQKFVQTSEFPFPTRNVRNSGDKIEIYPTAPQEKWSLVKINPVGYSRPKMKLVNVPSILLSDFSDLITDTEFTVTCISPGVFEITGDVIGTADSFIALGGGVQDVMFGGVLYFKIDIQNSVGPQPYTPIIGDFFTIDLEIEPEITTEIAKGYGLGGYGESGYDDRSYDLLNPEDLNFEIKPGQNIKNHIIEIKLLDTNAFTVKYYHRSDYLNGTKNEDLTLGSYPGGTVGTPYENVSVKFVVPFLDDFTFDTDDIIIIDPVNTPYFSSINMPFIHMYGTSYTDLPSRKWTFTAITNTSFETGINTAPFVSPNVLMNTAYDNSEVHFTAYSNFIRVEPNDKFWFRVYKEKPSYKVIGSISGETGVATVGKEYDNGKIKFTLAKPVAQLMSKVYPYDLPLGTLSPEALDYDIIELSELIPVNPTGYSTDINNIHLQFDRPVRSDAKSEVYKFTYSASNDSFRVVSSSGTKIGIDFSIPAYEWTDRLNNSTLSQNIGFDVQHADGNLAFTVLKDRTYSDGEEFYVRIVDHGLPLYHSNHGIMFKEISDIDTFVIEDTTEDKISLFVHNAAANSLETNSSRDTISLPSQVLSQVGIDSYVSGGDKKNEIALILKRNQEIADVGTINVDLYAANKPSVKVGIVRQRESLKRPVIEFEPNFISSTMGFLGTKFSVKVEQGQLLNTRVSTKFSESLKFASTTSYKRYMDFEGYDTLEYDDELQDIAYLLGYLDFNENAPFALPSNRWKGYLPDGTIHEYAQSEIELLIGDFAGYDHSVLGIPVFAVRIRHPGTIDLAKVKVISQISGVEWSPIEKVITQTHYDEFGNIMAQTVKIFIPITEGDDFKVIVE